MNFGRNSKIWRRSESLANITSLSQGLVRPNYPLQFDARYRIIWKTFQRLLKEEREIDDAWAWQRMIWGETGRQLIGCSLNQLFSEAKSSTPYYRLESRDGIWTESPVSPGPFDTPHGPLAVIDSRDLDGLDTSLRQRWCSIEMKPFRGAELIGACGCDQILQFAEQKVALLVWHFYLADSPDPESTLPRILSRCGKAIELLQNDVRRFSGSDHRLSGLLFVADLGRSECRTNSHLHNTVFLEEGPRLTSGGTVNALSLPPDVDERNEFDQNLPAGVGLAIEGALK